MRFARSGGKGASRCGAVVVKLRERRVDALQRDAEVHAEIRLLVLVREAAACAGLEHVWSEGGVGCA